MRDIGWIIIIAVLFLIVLWNSRRNTRKWKERKGKNFRDTYYERKKERESGTEEGDKK